MVKETPPGGRPLDPLTQRIVVAVSVALVLVFLWYIRGILTPFILAAVGAYLLHPVVDALQQRGVPRSWAILGIYLLIVLLLMVAVLMVVPVILDEAQRISADFPRYRRQVMDLISQLEESYARVELPEGLRQWPEDTLSSLQRQLPTVITATVQAVMGSAMTLVTLLMAALLAFYLLKDWREFSEGVLELTPQGWRQVVQEWAQRADRVLSGYIRGQIVIALIVGIVTGLALQIVGMRYAAIVAIAAGIGNLVPYLGAIVGGGLGLLLAGFQSWVMVIKVAVVFIVVQQLEGSVLAPNVMQYSVGVHPFWVIFSIVAGGTLFGFWGVVAAVPFAALLKESISVYRNASSRGVVIYSSRSRGAGFLLNDMTTTRRRKVRTRLARQQR